MQDLKDAISKLNLWIKVRDNEGLTLIDVPELIPLRWEYIKENWEKIKPGLLATANNIKSEEDTQGIKDSILKQIKEFDSLVNLKPKKGEVRE